MCLLSTICDIDFRKLLGFGDWATIFSPSSPEKVGLHFGWTPQTRADATLVRDAMEIGVRVLAVVSCLSALSHVRVLFPVVRSVLGVVSNLRSAMAMARSVSPIRAPARCAYQGRSAMDAVGCIHLAHVDNMSMSRGDHAATNHMTTR